MGDWETRLGERRSKFLTSCGERLSTIRALLELLSERPEDSAVLKQVHLNFHQMGGAGGIYDLTEVCRLSIAAEDFVERFLKESLPVTAADIAILRESLDSIRGALSASSEPEGNVPPVA